MPEDSTRRLLRVFGIAVTDCEDALDALEARWTEVGRLIQGYQSRGRAALAAALRAHGAA